MNGMIVKRNEWKRRSGNLKGHWKRFSKKKKLRKVNIHNVEKCAPFGLTINHYFMFYIRFICVFNFKTVCWSTWKLLFTFNIFHHLFTLLGPKRKGKEEWSDPSFLLRFQCYYSESGQSIREIEYKLVSHWCFFYMLLLLLLLLLFVAVTVVVWPCLGFFYQVFLL